MNTPRNIDFVDDNTWAGLVELSQQNERFKTLLSDIQTHKEVFKEFIKNKDPLYFALPFD